MWPKPPAPRCRLLQRLLGHEFHTLDAGHDELRDALAARDGEGLEPVVDEEDLHLAPVVGVDRAGAVEDGDAVLRGEAAAGPDLPLGAEREGELEPGRDEGVRAGRERDGLGDGGAEVEPGGAFGGVGGEVEPFAVREDCDRDADGIGHVG